MTKKPPRNKPDKLSNENGYITAKELMAALDSLKATILTEQKQQSLSSPMEDAPRPRIFHKKKKVVERNWRLLLIQLCLNWLKRNNNKVSNYHISLIQLYGITLVDQSYHFNMDQTKNDQVIKNKTVPVNQRLQLILNESRKLDKSNGPTESFWLILISKHRLVIKTKKLVLLVNLESLVIHHVPKMDRPIESNRLPLWSLK